MVISLGTYNSLIETVPLFRSPANVAHLQRSLEEACLRNAFVGIGKPEPLRENLSGCWSRRGSMTSIALLTGWRRHPCDSGLPLPLKRSGVLQPAHNWTTNRHEPT